MWLILSIAPFQVNPLLSLFLCSKQLFILSGVNTSFLADGIYWPMFIVATAAAIVASQATISATFSIIKQALALGCFPRVKVLHTSKKFLGQVYIPDINWVLLILCIIVSAGFRNTNQIGNAYGELVLVYQILFV